MIFCIRCEILKIFNQFETCCQQDVKHSRWYDFRTNHLLQFRLVTEKKASILKFDADGSFQRLNSHQLSVLQTIVTELGLVSP